MSPSIKIRPVCNVNEMLQIEAVQRAIWDEDERMIIHTHWMVTLAHIGALVLGAFDGARIVGFLIGMLGTDAPPDCPVLPGTLTHWSKRMGIHPSYQNMGIGWRLKMAQRRIVIRQGIEQINWSFDPLRSRNAYFNLCRLGAVAMRYTRDLYGALEDSQNDGLPSDRLIVDWWVSSPRVAQRLGGARRRFGFEHYRAANVPVINPAQTAPGGLLRPGATAVVPEGRIMLVEIPTDLDAIMRADLHLAEAWRVHIRTILEAAFAARYVATDFIHEVVDGRPSGFYVLSLFDGAA